MHNNILPNWRGRGPVQMRPRTDSDEKVKPLNNEGKNSKDVTTKRVGTNWVQGSVIKYVYVSTIYKTRS